MEYSCNPSFTNKPRGDTSELHYMSLHMDTTLLVTSAGPSAEHQGDMLGVYMEAGTHNNSPYYKQVDTTTERKDGEEHVIYRSKARGWVIGIGLGMDGSTRLKHDVTKRVFLCQDGHV